MQKLFGSGDHCGRWRSKHLYASFLNVQLLPNHVQVGNSICVCHFPGIPGKIQQTFLKNGMLIICGSQLRWFHQIKSGNISCTWKPTVLEIHSVFVYRCFQVISEMFLYSPVTSIECLYRIFDYNALGVNITFSYFFYPLSRNFNNKPVCKTQK